MSTLVSSSVCVCQRVTVRTKHRQVFKPVVVVVTIDMVQFQGNGFPLPFFKSATFTSFLFQPFAQKSAFQLVTLIAGTFYQDVCNISYDFWLKLQPHIPSLSCEVRSIQVIFLYSMVDDSIVSARWLYTKESAYRGNAVRVVNGFFVFCFCPLHTRTCLSPSCLPIPPSGHLRCKDTTKSEK